MAIAPFMLYNDEPVWRIPELPVEPVRRFTLMCELVRKDREVAFYGGADVRLSFGFPAVLHHGGGASIHGISLRAA
jgi:hypothetical protein